MYVLLKTRYINDRDNAAYSEFLTIYDRVLDYYEDVIVPHLVEADI
jgi:hypothetical protein